MTLAASFVITALTVRFLIPKLKSLKMGQKILDIGPRWHKSKEGTPTMGGLAFIFTSILILASVGTFLFLSPEVEQTEKLRFVFVVGFAAVNGIIGITDDSVKISHKQNEGLKAWQKMALQLVAASVFILLLDRFCGLNTAFYLPIVRINVELGPLYYPLAVIFIAGIVNSVNLTDGIDGLASSVTLIIGVYYACEAFRFAVPSQAVSAALMIGVCAGFLVYNFFPAKIFMGDTGSLFLGGLVCGLAFIVNEPLMIVIAGLWYVIESVSVILQVGYFKLTHGKRLFKMSPIHHHFEKCGWSEIKIVGAASFFTALLCAIAYLIG